MEKYVCIEYEGFWENQVKDEDVKIAILTHLGEDAVEIYNTFSDQRKDTLEYTLQAFDDHCVPNINYALETFKFNKISQNNKT